MFGALHAPFHALIINIFFHLLMIIANSHGFIFNKLNLKPLMPFKNSVSSLKLRFQRLLKVCAWTQELNMFLATFIFWNLKASFLKQLALTYPQQNGLLKGKIIIFLKLSKLYFLSLLFLTTFRSKLSHM